MTGLEDQIELLKFVGGELKSRTECLIIGGAAMMFYGIKNSTKDIDMVFFDETKRKNVISALEKAGFYKRYFKDKDIFLLERKDARFDMFLNNVMKFSISPAMAERKKEVHEFGNLLAMIASPEDIILLKCATDREGDRLDAKSLIEKFDIKWNMIIEEIKWQNEKSKKPLSLFLYDFLLELIELKALVPKNVIRELKMINEKEMDKLSKKR
ncbi:MAG: nucleotidyltransferase [Candidatus Aenigmarchaeota archaeon]|nr:nucleotidyltransferase [Candidatus Aenigmarchaeota archaeon]MDI6721932.1 nucleotidyltransferase [Candidatus Aenigmarchaeota archaeon]